MVISQQAYILHRRVNWVARRDNRYSTHYTYSINYYETIDQIKLFTYKIR